MKERRLSLFRPILRCRRDGEECLAVFLERPRRIAICDGDTTFEFWHRDHVKRHVWNADHIVLLHEICRFCDNFLRVINHGSVAGMLLGKLVQYRSRHFVFICDSLWIGVREIFFVERQRRFVDRGLRLLQIGLRPFQDFFHALSFHARRDALCYH